MADQSAVRPLGMITDVLVKIQDEYVPADFTVMEMDYSEIPLILGRPFLNTAHAIIYVGSGYVTFNIKEKLIKCPFNGFNEPKKNQPKRNRKSLRYRAWCGSKKLPGLISPRPSTTA